jgi:hypothetical protein
MKRCTRCLVKTGPRRGSENNKAKLTEAQVIDIRTRYAAGGITMRALAADYGVTFGPIQSIISSKTWRHI